MLNVNISSHLESFTMIHLFRNVKTLGSCHNYPLYSWRNNCLGYGMLGFLDSSSQTWFFLNEKHVLSTLYILLSIFSYCCGNVCLRGTSRQLSSLSSQEHFEFLKADFFTWRPTQLFDLIFDYTWVLDDHQLIVMWGEIFAC